MGEDREALAKALQSAIPAPRGFAIRDVLDALQPAVDAIARRRAAAELRKAAEECHLNISGRSQLRDRADALDSQ